MKSFATQHDGRKLVRELKSLLETYSEFNNRFKDYQTDISKCEDMVAALKQEFGVRVEKNVLQMVTNNREQSFQEPSSGSLKSATGELTDMIYSASWLVSGGFGSKKGG